jgi:hypothetical protein
VESVTLPALVLSRRSADAFVQDVIKALVPSIKKSLSVWNGEGEDWDRDERNEVALFEKDGTLPTFSAGIRAINVNGRNRTGLVVPEYSDDSFALLDTPGLQSVDIEMHKLGSGLSSLSLSLSSYHTLLSAEIYSLNFQFETLEELVLKHFELAVAPDVVEPRQPFRVFVGHGSDHEWRILRDSLRDHHDFDIEAFEGRPRAGKTIRDVIEEMAFHATAAVLVLTRADELADGTWHGRQNVIHELGFFQARLGWDRALIVVENGVILPSNLDGTQQVRYASGHIEGAVGEVVATLKTLKTLHEMA